jgi:deazaflavin-dependent oxidoreductase (nitroreductase family)
MDIDGIMTRANPLIRGVLRSPLHGLLSRGLMLLTITGRRSGVKYSIPVGYQPERGNEDALTVMVSEARRKQWWRNFREPGAVDVLLRGRPRSGTATLIAPDSEAFRRCAERTLRRVPAMRRVFKVPAFDPDSGLTDAEADLLALEIAAVKIELDPHSR